MRRLTLCLAALSVLAMAGEASAKEIMSAKVCGASDCRTVKDKGALLAFGEGGPPTDPPDHPIPWYRARLTVDTGGGHSESFWIVLAPAAGLVRGTDQMGGAAWLPVSRDAVRTYRAVTRGLAPFPAGRLTGLESPDPPKVRVDEIVLPPQEPQRSSGGGVPAWPFVLGGLALAGCAVLVLRRRAGPGGAIASSG
jgi:hypothetical protein